MKLSDSCVVALDTETTGVDVASARVVEIGAAVRSGAAPASEVVRRRSLVNPGIPIPAEARDVHGIGDDDVAGAEPFSVVWPRVLDFVHGLSSGGVVVTGYNVASYDLALLSAEAVRHGVDFGLETATVIDPITFVRWRRREVSGRLTDAAASEGIYPRRGLAHSAAVDAEMSLALLFALVDKGLIPDDVDTALSEQNRLRPLLEAEYARWGSFLYRDRDSGRLRMGAGKHRGQLLSDVPRSYLKFVTDRFTDLMPETKHALTRAMSGDFSDEMQESMPGIAIDDTPVSASGGQRRGDGDVRR